MSNELVQRFLNGLREALNDITALEVNTMIVTQIRGMKFNPEEAYCGIYDIPKQESSGESEAKAEAAKKYRESYYEFISHSHPEKPMNDDIKKRHMQLRERLDKVCQSMEFKVKPEKAEQLRRYNAIEPINEKAGKVETDGETITLKGIKIKRLPLPDSLYTSDENIENPNPLKSEVESESGFILDKENQLRTIILENNEVLRRLRKLNELKSLLESSEASVDSNIYDSIYAQTVLQIDGDVINRFDKKIFNEEDKETRDLLLQIHQEAVKSGEENWRSLLTLSVDLIKNIINGIKGVN